MPTRLRKLRRLRGSRTHGYGQVGQHRPSGSRGGRGDAGLHKHRWTWTVKYAPNHFGKAGFHPPGRKAKVKWVNVGVLDGLWQRLSEEKRSPRGKMFTIDLSKMGFNKLLGGGRVTKAFRVIVPSATESAKAKVKAAQGEVVEG